MLCALPFQDLLYFCKTRSKIRNRIHVCVSKFEQTLEIYIHDKTTIPKKTMLSCIRRKSLKETIYLKKKEMQRRNMGDVIKVTLTIYNLLNVSLDKYTNVQFKCFMF